MMHNIHTYRLTKERRKTINLELFRGAIFYFGIVFILQLILPSIFAEKIFGLSPILYWSIPYFLAVLPPLLTVHFQYLKYNKNTELSIDKINRVIKVKENNDVFSFAFDQISRIQMEIRCWIVNGKMIPLNPVDRYHYALIETQDGHRFFITSLLNNNLVKLFDENGLYYKKETVLWPRIRLSRHSANRVRLSEEQLMKINIGLIATGILLLATFILWPFNQPPNHEMIGVGFYICNKCQSAEGGIYGKGPVKIFNDKNIKWCIHDWRKVDKREFKEYTHNEYLYDWSKELYWWNN